MGLNDTYHILNKLENGSFSNVFLAVHRPTGIKVAIKIISKSDDDQYSNILHEVEILKSINHPNILKLYEYFEDDTNCYLVQELCDHGNIAQYINENGPSESPEIKIIFLQIIKAFSYLQNFVGIVHRNIKAENILLDSHNNVKITGFGFADNQQIINNQNQIKGTPTYIAPEVLYGGSNSFQSDIWSLGVLLYYITNGILPFEDDDINGLIFSIENMKPAFPSHLSVEVSKLIKNLLKKNPKERFSLNEIKNNVWCKEIAKSIEQPYKNFQQNGKRVDKDIIEKIMQINSTKSISFETIVNDLFKDKINDLTAHYKILICKKENEILCNHLKSLNKIIDSILHNNKKVYLYSDTEIKRSRSLNFKDIRNRKITKVSINSKRIFSKVPNPMKYLE